MSDYVTALTGAGTAAAVGLVALARSWPTTNPARHRAANLLPSEEVLCGRPEPYTTVDPNADTQAFGVVKIGLGWCESCWATKAGVITRNGFRCDDYAQHPGAAS